MSKQQKDSKLTFDYSKWDNIELSDDEDDVHPNIDRESWFRLKHRSRVEREENEAKDRANIIAQMDKANQRIAVLKHDLAKLDSKQQKDDDDDDDDDDDVLDDREALQAELDELEQKNASRQAKLEEYERNKKWNIDNLFQVKEERTMVNPHAGEADYSQSTGFVLPKQDEFKPKTTTKSKDSSSTLLQAKSAAAPSATTTTTTPAQAASDTAEERKTTTTTTSSSTTSTSKPPAAAAAAASASAPATTTSSSQVGPDRRNVDVGVFETYPEFTEKYADTIEEFMAISDLDASHDFLLHHADILLQENASNYLLLASLEDEMNGHRDKMKRTARQSQLVSNIAELAKTLDTHPGNVIEPFFARLQQREHLEEFVKGCKAFEEKIIQRAIVKRQEMDAARATAVAATSEEGEEQTTKDLQDIPREERLGPGGLDPLEVIETLPEDMVKAFESRNVDDLKEALMKLDPADAEYHMKRCVDSGLWVANA